MPMSLQEMFDTVVTTLRQQGCQSMRDSSVSSICMYRGMNNTKCAVGHLIPDELYSKEMEGFSISSWVDMLTGICPANPEQRQAIKKAMDYLEINPVDVRYDIDNESSASTSYKRFTFLRLLQAIHDGPSVTWSSSDLMDRWEKDWRSLASKYNLIYTPPAQTPPL